MTQTHAHAELLFTLLMQAPEMEAWWNRCWHVLTAVVSGMYVPAHGLEWLESVCDMMHTDSPPPPPKSPWIGFLQRGYTYGRLALLHGRVVHRKARRQRSPWAPYLF